MTETPNRGPIWAMGLISGTSMDGVDAATLLTDGETVLDFGPADFRPFSAEERAVLRAGAAAARAASTADLRDAARWPEPVRAAAALTSDTHAETASRLAARRSVAALGLHGQTLVHRIEDRLTLQVGDFTSLAETVRAPVVHDFRSADVAAGGQGAPLVPAYHRALAARMGEPGPIAFLNLGGVANVTWVDGDRVIAFDTGPANGPLDDWMADRTGQPRDEGGRAAAAGRVDPAILAALLDDPFFAAPWPKSLDREAFPRALAAVAPLGVEDGAATLVAFAAAATARAIPLLPAPPALWALCGGGRQNPALVSALAERLPGRVAPVEEFGLDGDMIEAQAFAFLAVRVLRSLPTTYPETTGAPAPLSGGRVIDPRRPADAA